ncbi:MAG TPA: pilus assembly protein TadG-related protein, partial [Candidatus Acidoferrum sp.]|nr:pilus assembly protein TadG-related protein [Candidatus Acidoferrum sp.]
MKKIFGSSRGQIMVLYVGILATLLGAVAMGTDVAVMYTNWQQTQKVADAAALAGANYLAVLAYPGTIDATCTGQPDEASKVACDYAVK